MSRTIKVLVVDDERIIQNYIFAALSDPRFQVQTVSKGDEAVALTEVEAFDLAFVDIRLNGSNGIDICRRMKQARPRLRVVLMTAYESSTVIEQAKLAGADLVIYKPIDLDILIRLAEGEA